MNTAWLSQEPELERVQTLLGGYLDTASVSANPAATKLNYLPASLQPLLVHAGIDANVFKRVALRMALAAGLVILLALAIRWWIIFIIPALIWLQLKQFQRKVISRAQLFERDYTALLLSLASGVRTGLDPLQALSNSAELFQPDSLVRAEILRLRSGIESGLTEDQLLREFAITIDHPDIKLFRTAFILARREGSSLAECLQRLARVTRQRQSFRRKVKGAVAMQKLSAYGIGACTIVIGIIQVTTNPQATIAAINHPMGFKVLLAGAGLVVLGVAWMISLTKSRT